MKSDETLFADAMAGGPEQFAPVVARYQDAVFGIALARLGDFHAAQDVAQEVFVAAFAQLGNLKDPSRLGAWLRSIAIHQSIRYLRRQRQTHELHDGMEHDNKDTQPHAALERKELRDTVLAAIRQLSKTQRETTTLFYVNGYSVAEVAAIQEVPVGTVKCRLHDARDKLKTELIGMVENVLKSEAPKEDFAKMVFELVTETSRPGGRSLVDIVSRVRTAGPEGLEGLKKAFESPHWRTRQMVLGLLTTCISPDNVEDVVAIVKQAFRDPSPKVRGQAVTMTPRLAIISDDQKCGELVPGIVELLSDPNGRVRRAASWELQHHWPGDVTLEQAVRTYLDERHGLTREWKEHLLRATLTAHSGENPPAEPPAEEQIARLSAQLKSENASRGRAVCDLLHLQVDNETKRRVVLPLVLPMLADRARRVRWRTAYELRSWAADVPIAAIRKALKTETKAGVSEELKRLLARAEQEQGKR